MIIIETLLFSTQKVDDEVTNISRNSKWLVKDKNPAMITEYNAVGINVKIAIII